MLQIKPSVLILITSLLLINFTPLSAQTWQWGKRGGGAINSASLTPSETVIDMATDKNGNLYVLARSIKVLTNPDFDGHMLTAWGDRDIVLTKFNCDGSFKWSKVIGGDNADVPTAVGVDTVGHVYICGKTYSDVASGVHFDADTVQTSSIAKNLFLIQYDTAGNFRWLRQPNPDTSTVLHIYGCESYDLKITEGGDIFWLVKLHEGLVSGGNGWAVSSKKPFILHYNVAGALMNHIDLQMETEIAGFYEIGLERTRSGKFIIAGGQDYYPGISGFTIGGQLITHSLFIAMFGPNGQVLWKKENKTATRNSRISSRPISDASGSIYLGGTISNKDTFQSYGHRNFHNPNSPGSADPFAAKLDSSGNIIWLKAASGLSNNYTASIALKGANELWLSGDYTSVWWDSSTKVQTTSNGGTHFYITRLNTLGNVLDIDSLKGPTGTNNYFHCSSADNKGNIYIGGEFTSSLNVAAQTLINSGGTTDFFTAKLGNPCNCTTPIASFNKSVSASTVSLVYTGTTAGIDSVIWYYGNNVSVKKTGGAISTPFSYTYPANGTYNICVTAYGTCGSDQNCQNVVIRGTGVGTVTGTRQIRVYPNPASEYIVIEGADKATKARLVNLLGQDMISLMNIGDRETISLRDIPSGTYLLSLIGQYGFEGAIRIVKQ